MTEPNESTLSVEELRQYNAELRVRINELETRIRELKSAAESTLKKINSEQVFNDPTKSELR